MSISRRGRPQDGDVLAVGDALAATPESAVDGLIELEATTLEDPVECRRGEADSAFGMLPRR